jgi:O-antigen ligase
MTWSNPTDLTLEGQISRFQGIFDNPNAVGALMLYTVTPILAFWSSFQRRQKMILSLVVVLALGTGALADSRSPFAALMVGCLLFVLWRYRAKGLVVMIGVMVVAIAALPIFGGYMGEYVGGRDVGTLTGRTEIWAFALQQLREHPIRGYGYQSSGAIFQSRYFTEWYGPWDEGAQSSLHNGYLTQAVGVGVPAAIFWLYILVRPFVFLFSRKEDPWNLKPVFFLVLVPMLTLNLTEASLESFLGLDGILFGLVWGAAEMYRLSAEEKEKIAQEEALAQAPFGFVSS